MKHFTAFNLKSFKNLLILSLLVIGIISAVATNTQAASTPSVSNWWPANNAAISDVQSFKGVLNNANVANYTMYWEVDGRSTSLMDTNNTDYPHKEALVDVSKWNWSSSGNYYITYIAKSLKNVEIARTTFMVNLPVSPPASAVATPTAKPFEGQKLYTIPNSNAAAQATQWRTSRPLDAAQMDKLASQPTARWFGGWNSNVEADAQIYTSAATVADAVPVLVAYNIPQRDCGGYSAGGALSENYLTWIKQLATGIGSRSAIVILEPDAVANLDCLSADNQTIRLSLLSQAVTILKANPTTYVYLDGGNPRWKTADLMAARLQSANVSNADGFSLNVSNFMTTDENSSYGQAISAKLADKHFVIDTSRNGSGPTTKLEWCNPSGRSLGVKPTTSTNSQLIDAYLWIKTPGESDGQCNGGPVSGAWWADYGLGLAQRAAF